MTSPRNPTLSLVQPPAPLPDLTQASLVISLSEINQSLHHGRKLRLIGQILWFDPNTSLALLTIPIKPLSNQTLHPTLLVNLSVPLLGTSSSIPLRHPTLSGDLDLSSTLNLSRSNNEENGEDNDNDGHCIQYAIRSSGTSSRNGIKEGKGVNRSCLVIARGEWVRVVGWLDGPTRRVKLPEGFASPPESTLEAIFISPAREPPTPPT